MSLFGSDYPPGCHSTPFDEYGTSDVSAAVSAIVGEKCFAYWGEDGALIGCRASDLQSSEDSPPFLKQDLDWADEKSDEENFAAAAQAIAKILQEGPPAPVQATGTRP